MFKQPVSVSILRFLICLFSYLFLFNFTFKICPKNSWFLLKFNAKMVKYWAKKIFIYNDTQKNLKS